MNEKAKSKRNFMGALSAAALVGGAGLWLLLSGQKNPSSPPKLAEENGLPRAVATNTAPAVASGVPASSESFPRVNSRRYYKMSTLAWRKSHPELFDTNLPSSGFDFHLLPEDRALVGKTFQMSQWGRLENSQQSRDMTVEAMSNFVANADRAGLILNQGDITRPMRVESQPGASVSIAKSESANVYFESMLFSSTNDKPLVTSMTAIGRDINGVSRTFSPSPSPSLMKLSDATLYGSQCTPDETTAAVISFVALQVDAEYAISKVSRCDYPKPTPIVTYVFTPTNQCGEVRPMNSIEVTVIDGGPEVKKGHPKILSYEDNDAFFRVSYPQLYPAPKFLKPQVIRPSASTNGPSASTYSLPFADFGVQ